MAPVAGPPAVGWKLIVMLQFDPAFSDAGQLFDSRNGPVTVMEEIASGPGPFAVRCRSLPPLFVPTIWLENARLVGLNTGAFSTPLPDSAAETAPPCELLETVRDPVRMPVTDGVKLTLMVQLVAAASVVPQLFVCAKSPVIVIAEIVSGAVPVFDSVALWAGLVVPITWLPKLRLAGESIAIGAVPVPASDTLCGLPEALSVTVTEPVRVPTAVGVKVTLIVQRAPAPSVVPQVFVWAKLPVLVIAEIASGALPVFESVVVWARLVVPTNWPPNARLAGESIAIGAVPVPVSETVCGLPEALSVTVTEPDRVPMVAGVKVTLIVQVAPTASVVPQLFVSAKSPVIVIPEMVNGAVPVFESVALCVGLAVPIVCPLNVRVDGEAVAMGAVPVPVSDTLCGLPDALSTTVTEPDRVPVALGVKVTLIEQLAAAARVAPHVFVSAKSPLLVMFEIAIASLPVFDSVMVCAALVVPTGCAPKSKLVGVRLATGAPPVPASATVCGLPEAVSFKVRLPVMFPVTVGEKLTLMEQLAPAASEEPQLSVSAKLALTEIANKSF
jgi:hypothetical protein